nr:MaoC family dehydratase N-terminal domain-containing protein [Motilibacter deserti]
MTFGSGATALRRLAAVPLDASLAGRSYPASAPYEIGREKLRELAEALGDTTPAYVDPDAARALGYPEVVAPPTFPFLVAWRGLAPLLADPELGIGLERVVHGDQRFALARPLQAGDRVTGAATVESVRVVGGNALISVRVDLRAEDGEELGSAWSSLLVRAPEAAA